jgi:hypothetical protein
MDVYFKKLSSMHNFIFIPSLLIFLFTLYKLAKDDHVFLRKNVRLEQFFDMGFIVLFTSWIISIIFSPSNTVSLTYVVTGGALALFLLGKYRKLPVGRLFDFFTVSLLAAAPAWFLLLGLITKDMVRIINFSYAFFYIILFLYFLKGILPRVMNRTIKEGSLTVFFLIIFSIASLFVPVLNFIRERTNILTAENILLVVLFILSLALILRPRR